MPKNFGAVRVCVRTVSVAPRVQPYCRIVRAQDMRIKQFRFAYFLFGVVFLFATAAIARLTNTMHAHIHAQRCALTHSIAPFSFKQKQISLGPPPTTNCCWCADDDDAELEAPPLCCVLRALE